MDYEEDSRDNELISDKLTVEGLGYFERLVTEEEFALLGFPSGEYPLYLDRFYTKALHLAYAAGLGKESWFVERGLCHGKDAELRDLERFEQAMRAHPNCELTSANSRNLLESSFMEVGAGGCAGLIVVKNIGPSFSVREFLAAARELPLYRGHSVTQHSYKEGLRRTIYLETEEGREDEYKQMLQPELPRTSILIVQKVDAKDPRGIRETTSQFGTEKAKRAALADAKEIFEKMCNVFGSAEARERVRAIEEAAQNRGAGAPPDMYVLALRRIFSFCYYCGCKYDNVYEMLFKCGAYHVRGDMAGIFNNRRFRASIAFYKRKREVSRLEGIYEAGELAKMYVQEGDERFRCTECGKAFMAMEFIEKHLRNKHPEKVAEISGSREWFDAVLRELDYHLAELIERTEDPLPKYLHRKIQLKLRDSEKRGLVSYAGLKKTYPGLAVIP